MRAPPNVSHLLKNYREFTRTFGIGGTLQTSLLVGGGVVACLLELAGLSILFPLISLILQPEHAQSNIAIRWLSQTTGITDTKQLTSLIGFAIAAVFILKNIFQIVYLNYERRVLTQWRQHIVNRMYTLYTTTSYERFMQQSSGQMINMLTTTIPYVLTNYIHKSLTLLNYALTGTVIIIFMLITSWQVSLMLLAVGALVVSLYSRLFRTTSRRLGQQSHELTYKQHSLLQQAIGGYKETQSHLKEDYFTERFFANSKKLITTEGKIIFLQNLPMASVELFVMSLLILMFQTLLLTNSNITLAVSHIGIIVFASLRMIPVINRSIVCTVMINSAVQPLNRLMTEVTRFGDEAAIFQKKTLPSKYTGNSTENSAPLPFYKALTLQDISYAYPESALPTLRNLNLTVKPGEFIGISGPSGSGKSTLVNVLLGFLTRFEGSYKIDDTEITPANIRNLRHIIGFVDQQIFMMETSIAENVAYGTDVTDIDRKHVEECLKKAQLWEFVQTLPHGMDTPVGENGKLLSGGQRQRIAIARAFYRDLKILILDEASASLDIETEHKFFSFLKQLKGDLTVIMIAHRLSTLKECDKILFMENGSVIDEGTFAGLSKSNAKFRQYIEHSNITLPSTAAA